MMSDDIVELNGDDLEYQDEGGEYQGEGGYENEGGFVPPSGQHPAGPLGSPDGQPVPPHQQVVLHPAGVVSRGGVQLPGGKTNPEPYGSPLAYAEEEIVTGESDLEAEPTRIESDVPGMEEAPEDLPRLVTIGGNDRGKEFSLHEGDNSIGRGLDNVVVLADIAVSRKHTLICNEGGQFVLRDLGSGNGTLVNGRRVHTHPLKDGDQIELGNTLLRFVLPQAALADAATVVGQVEGYAGGAVPPVDPNMGLRTMDVRQLPAEALPPVRRRGPLTRRQKLLIFGGGGVFFLLLLMIGVKIFLNQTPPPPKPRVNKSAEVSKEYNLGLKYFRMQKWAKARKHYLRVFALAPGYEVAKTYAKEAANELRAQEALNDAKKAVKEEKYDLARDTLAKIPPKSYYAPMARLLKQRCDDKQLAKLLTSAKALKEGGDTAAALVKVKEARRIAPTNLIVKKLYEELEGGEPTAPPEATPGKKIKRTPKRHRYASSTPRHKPSSSSGRPIRVHGAGIAKALAAYRRKEWGVAYSALVAQGDALHGRRRQKVKRLAKAVQQVGMNVARGLKTQISNPRAALRYYKIALKYDRQIPHAPHQAMLKKQLYKVAKISATTSFTDGNYASAYQAIKTAKRLRGLDSTLQHLLTRLDKKAMELFTRGYTMRSRSPKKARRLWQTVIRMVPPKSTAYQKAYSWLNNSTPRYQDEDED